jgi:hypothetical protein
MQIGARLILARAGSCRQLSHARERGAGSEPRSRFEIVLNRGDLPISLRGWCWRESPADSLWHIVSPEDFARFHMQTATRFV